VIYCHPLKKTMFHLSHSTSNSINDVLFSFVFLQFDSTGFLEGIQLQGIRKLHWKRKRKVARVNKTRVLLTDSVPERTNQPKGRNKTR
jgi:hypothetical protein